MTVSDRAYEIIRHIDATLKRHSEVMGEPTPYRKKVITMALIGSLPVNDKLTREVMAYCEQYLNIPL